MKINLKAVAAVAALALWAGSANAALTPPSAPTGSDLLLNVYNGSTGFAKDIGLNIGTWNPAAAYSITITDTTLLAAITGGSNWNIVAANAGTTAFATTVDTNNAANLGGGVGDTNQSIDQALASAGTFFAGAALSPGQTFSGGATGSTASVSSDGWFGSNIAAGAGNLSEGTTRAIPSVLPSSTQLFFALLTGNTADPFGSPTVNVYAGAWTLAAAAGGASAVLSWTPTAVPLPAAVWLFGSGLLGLAGVGRRRQTLVAA